MLICICAVAGKGKTALATQLAIKNSKKNRPIFSNYNISWKTLGLPITSQIAKPEYFKEQSFPENSFIIIDEAQNFYNSRFFKDMTQDEIEYFSGHRHMGMDIVITTQHPARVDIVLRQNCEKFIWIRHKLPFGFKICYEYVLPEDVGFLPPRVSADYCKRKIYRVNKAIYTMYDDHYLKDKFIDRVEDRTLYHDYHRNKYRPLPLRIYLYIRNLLEYYNSVYLAYKEYKKTGSSEDAKRHLMKLGPSGQRRLDRLRERIGSILKK